MLSVENIAVRFNGLTALHSVTFQVAQGEIHAIIGPNGAGKTTLFNVISGMQRPSEGRLHLAPDTDLTSVPLHARAASGIARTFQNIRLFSSLSALENVMLGATPMLRASGISAALGLPLARREERDVWGESIELLGRVGLRDAAHTRAGDLPYGSQRRLEIARALAARPRLLLLDEPAAGMNDAERRTLEDLIRSLRGPDMSILIVEHDMPFIMGLCDRITVLNFGKLIASGSPTEVRCNPAVISAYLGSEAQELEHA